MKRLIYGVIGVAMAAWTASEMRAESAMTAMDEQPETTTEEKAEELLELVKEIANGKETKNEIYGCREIAIFKDGVTL